MMKNKELRLFAILLVILLASTEALLAYNTLYTEGEVMQSIYWFLVAINIPIFIYALWKPKTSLWAAVALGALLLPWQASENRKWAIIHEEIFAIVHHVDSQKKENGKYPVTLDNYEFRRPWIREHVSYSTTEGKYRISYFMDNSGTGYWYYSDTGFGYYPD